MLLDAQRLASQLSKPDEQPLWWPIDAGAGSHIRARFEDCSHALVVPVSQGDATQPDAVRIERWPEDTNHALALTRLPSADAPQQLASPRWPDTATHLLVMGWALQPPPARTWDRKPLSGRLSPGAPVLAEVVLSSVLQAALDLLRADSPGAISASLLPLPARTSPGK